jgi:hypothetical protein
MTTTRTLLRGAVAGAAGTTALNLVTYADMVVRGRGASSTPEQSVETLADKAHVPIPGDDETRSNRVSGLGPMLGSTAGMAGGVALAVAEAMGLRPPLPVAAALTGLSVMASTDSQMAVLGVSDPRSWRAQDWLADAVPHAVYGAVTAWTLREMVRRG